MHRLGVLGWPVAHSRSPAMFNAAFAALGLDDWHYQRLPAAPEAFADTVRGLPGAGFVGANVTMPHKAAALALADTASDAARAIGAANTLTFGPDGAVDADNTDAPGLLAALGAPVTGKTAVVAGAGGSARAIVWALREAGAADVAVWNRTPERARELADAFGVRAIDALQGADVLVHCTSIGLDGADAAALLGLPPLDAYGTVVDFVYTPAGTALLTAAAAAGCATVDGREILVRQGAVGFERWTGVEAPLGLMRQAVSDA
jgi:shikimate dehydrogenase